MRRCSRPHSDAAPRRPRGCRAAGGTHSRLMHIPLRELRELRSRLDELPRDREIIVHCESGQRWYNACRLLSQNGFQVRN